MTFGDLKVTSVLLLPRFTILLSNQAILNCKQCYKTQTCRKHIRSRNKTDSSHPLYFFKWSEFALVFSMLYTNI